MVRGFYNKDQRGSIERFKQEYERIGFIALKDVSGCCSHGIIFFLNCIIRTNGKQKIQFTEISFKARLVNLIFSKQSENFVKENT